MISNNCIIDKLAKILCKGPQTLMIKGEPGSGKTTLAFTVMKKINKCRSCFYFAAREDIIKITEMEPELIKGVLGDQLIQLKLPKYLPISEIKEGVTYLEFEGKHPLLKKIYELTENQKKSFVIIDSIDAVEEEIVEGSSLRTLIKDLVEIGSKNNISLILTREKDQTEDIDYLADIVIFLKKEYFKDRLIRYMNISKNKFFPIDRSFYPFSLTNHTVTTVESNFTFFPSKSEVKPFKIKPHEKDKFFSSMPIFDEIVTKGFWKGSTILFGKDIKLPFFMKILPLIILCINFLLQDRPVYVIPSAGFPEAAFYRLLRNWVPKEKKHLNFFRFRPNTTLTRFLSWDRLHANVKEYLKVIALSPLEAFLNKDEIIAYINKNILEIQKRKGFLVIVGEVGTPTYEYVKRLVSYKFEVYNLKFDQILIFEEPSVPTVFLLRPHLDNGYPEIDALPIL